MVRLYHGRWLPLALGLSAGCGRLGYDAIRVDAGRDDASDGATSVPSVLGHVCDFTSLVVVSNGDPVDEAAGDAMASSITRRCGTNPSVERRSQDDLGVLEPGTSRPILGPATLAVVAGGDFTQRIVAYLQTSLTPVTSSQTGVELTLADRTTMQSFGTFDLTTLGGSHDVAIVQVVREDASGTFVVNVYGQSGWGTEAGVFYFANVLGPTLPSNTQRYYVIEWTDENGNQVPDVADTFAVLGSG